MKVLVTGATGFIGSHLTELLIGEDYPVRALVRESSDLSHLRSLGAVETVYGDIRDTDTVKKAVKDCDVIYHIAAKTTTARASRKEYFETNAEGTKNLAEAALKSKIKRFVYCSTGGVYGFVTYAHPRIDENTKTNPNSYYRESKLLGENILDCYHQKQELPIVTARITSVYGPRSSNWLGLFQVIAKGNFKKIGDGSNHLDICYVSDISKGLLLCGETQGIEGECYIIAGSEKATLKQFSDMIADELGVEIPSDCAPKVPFRMFSFFARMTYRHFGYELPRAHSYEIFLADRVFDTSKAQKELGYEPRVSMREGIERTVKWYRGNNSL